MKSSVSELLDRLGALIEEAGSCRIDVSPPGHFGAVALVASVGATSADRNFSNSFVDGGGVLGTRVALSGATLAKQPGDSSQNVTTSILDAMKDQVPWLGAVQGNFLLELWGGALTCYSNGQEGLIDGIRNVCSSSKLVSISGLGPWAADALESCLEKVGLQAADMSVSRPVTVNSYHPLSADDSAFSSRLLSSRSYALSNGEGGLLSSALSALVVEGADALQGLVVDYAIAAVDFTGSDVGKQVLTVVLPDWVDGFSAGLVDSIKDRLNSAIPSFAGVRQWE